jgi:hypothetical protein
MITLEDDALVFRCPEIHPKAQFSLSFQRTLRIPDDGRDYPLPPGLGRFSLRHIEDYAKRVPERWLRRGGIILPMFQAEAMWLSFGSCLSFDGEYPFALKVATGKINAVTGAPWSQPLCRDPQDYLVLPEQPWLDGYSVEKGIIRQFVAAPMGRRITVEEQLTGEAEWGGIQLLAYPMKRERFDRLEAERRKIAAEFSDLFAFESDGEPGDAFIATLRETVLEMRCSLGLAPGGRMHQQIFEDEFNVEDWDQEHGSRCFVTIANSADWTSITGEAMPSKPVTARDYAAAGLHWYDYYAEAPALDGSTVLQGVKSIANTWGDAGQDALDLVTSVAVGPIVQLGARPVREMQD